MRDEKRRSKGRKEGLGLPMRGREANEGRMLLPGEERMEPFVYRTNVRPDVRIACDPDESKS